MEKKKKFVFSHDEIIENRYTHSQSKQLKHRWKKYTLNKYFQILGVRQHRNEKQNPP